MKKIPVYNIVINKGDGISKMSLVDYPAVESDFLKFEKDEKKMLFSMDEEQHIVFGCALRADYPIYRNNKGFEYFVVFSSDVIKELYENFMIDGLQNDVNLQHTEDTDGVFLIQSMIKDTKKGICPTGFEDIADGSWFVAYKINNEEVWEGVKRGEFNGFSVEAYLDFEERTDEDDLNDLMKKILAD